MNNRQHRTGLLSALALLSFGCLSVFAQPIIAPATESFDAALSLPAGWVQDTTDQADWTPNSGSTVSSGTGPSGDATSGTGNYFYFETSSPVSGGDQAILESPEFDITALSNPGLTFSFHMYGEGPGGLTVEASDGVGGWAPLWSHAGDEGDRWYSARMALPGYLNNPLLAKVRFVATAGSVGFTFASDVAIDDVAVEERRPSLWQPASAVAALDTPGLPSASPSRASGLAVDVFSGAPYQLSLASNVVGASFEMLFTTPNSVPMFGGGTISPSFANVLNLDQLDPSYRYVNGGLQPFYFPLGGASATFSATPPIAGQSYSLQMSILDPSSPDGLTLSQAVDFVGVAGIIEAGPTGDDSSSMHSFVGKATHPGSMSVLGTTYTDFGINSNGTVTFGYTSSTLSGTAFAAAGLPGPAFGLMTDLNVAAGGSISVSYLAGGMVRIEYDRVPYFGGVVPISFAIILDGATGSVTLDGLTGIVDEVGNSDDRWIGFTPGNTATDPGALTFTSGGFFSQSASTDMLYDYANPLPASLVPGTLNQIIFVPVTGGYDAIGL